jgi:WD40 repeat protein
MSADPDPGAAPVQVQAGDGGAPHVDARQAVGVQVGQDNTQIVYVYGKGTWSDGVAAPPLVSVAGKVDSPYRGLRAFEERDAPFFFGRETATAEVLKRMSWCRDGTGLLVVSGVSGAGKSSLLRAGVLPQVRGTGLEAVPEAASWPRLLFTPGPTPLDVLAVQVAYLAGIDAAAVRSGLDDNPARFALTARQAALAQLGGSPGEPDGLPPGPLRKQRLLLVVDQFEQVFTQCPDEKQRQAFITALCAAGAADGPEQDPAALIVLGVRADFEARCADFPQLAGAIQARYLVTSMTERQLRMAITEPAKRAGSRIDEDLVDVLLEEVSTRQPGSPGAIPGRSSASGAGILPLLSHALDQAWRSRAGDVLTLADYERTGGIEGAVADSAQHAYDSLTPAQQATARQIFTRLTATTTDSVDTAERASRAELTEGRDAAQERDVEAVLEAFASERLLTLAAGTVEISHEVVLTSWPLLRDTWLAETHADRVVRTRLHNAAAEWETRSRDPSYLYSGSLLETAAATTARISADPVRYPPLSQTERDFVGASERAQTRRIRRRQGIIAFLVVLVVGLAATTFLTIRSNQETASERDKAVAGQLVAESEQLGDTNPVLAKRESLAAWQIDPGNPAARYAMLTAARLPGIGVLTNGGISVNAVAYSPDGKILATGGGDGIVRLWDAATQQQIGVPLGTFSAARLIESVAFSPDGQIVAAAGEDGVVRLWDVATQRPIGSPLTGDVSTIYSIAFSPDGDLLAAGHSDGTVQLWDVASGQPMGASLAPHAGEVLSVAFSPDGATLATASTSAADRSTVQMWDVNSRQPIGGPLAEQALGTSALGSLTVSSVAFSPGGKTLAAGSSDGVVQLWNVTSRAGIGWLFTDDFSEITSVGFSPDGEFVAAGDDEGTTQLWDVATLQQIGIPLTADIRRVDSVAFSPDGRTLATGSNDGTARLWDVALDDNDLTGFVTAGAQTARSVAFSPDGKILATSDFDGTTRLWNAATQHQLGGPLVGDGASVYSLAFSPDGKILATGSNNGTARLWDVASGSQIGATLVGHAGPVWSVAFSRDGKTLASGNGNATVQLWDVATGQQTGTLRTTGAVYSLAFSPDGTMLATGSSDGTARLWDMATGRQIGVFSTGQDLSVFSVAFSPDGKILATGGYDRTARLWDVATYQQIGASLSGATASVSSVTFSPDGQTLAAGSYDGTVRLWDVATNQQIGAALASGDDEAVRSVAFSPDGNVLAAGYGNGVVQLRNVRYLTNVVSSLCASAGGSFTPSEWTQYVQGPAYQKTCP